MSRSRQRTAQSKTIRRTAAHSGPPAASLSAPAYHELSKRIWLHRAVIAAASLLTYSNALHGPFLFDDVVAIRDNAAIREWWNLATIFKPEVGVPLAGRPLAILSFAANYGVGGLAVEGYHLVNIAIHICCALLLYAILRRSFDRPRFPGKIRRRAADLAFAGALLWTVHPLNSEAVDYLLQRTESLMALCLLGTLYASIRAIDSRHIFWQALAVLSCLLGMLTKESMVVAPLLVVLYDGTVGFESWGVAWRDRWRFYAALAATWAPLAGLLWLDQRADPRHAFDASGTTPVTVWMYLLNQPPLILRYLRLAMWPTRLVTLYGAPAAARLFDVWLSATVLIVALGASAFLIVRRSWLGLLGAWVFVTLAPTSSFMPLTTEVAAERRMYLPMMALVTLTVIAVYTVGRRAAEIQGARAASSRWVEAAAAVALLAVAFLLARATLERNREYQSGLTLAQTSVARWPTGEGYYQLGSELEAAGRHDEAVGAFRTAAETFPRARFYLGQALFSERELEASITELRGFIQAQPWAAEVIRAHLLIGGARSLQGRPEDAIEEARAVLSMTPENVDAHFLLADALSTEARFKESVPHYRAYLAARPGDVRALTNLGAALAVTGDEDEALATFRRAVDLDPRTASLHANIARVLIDRHEVVEAAAAARQAAALEPASAANHELFGRALALQGRFDEARGEFERALQLDPASEDARDDLARLTQVAPRPSSR